MTGSDEVGGALAALVEQIGGQPRQGQEDMARAVAAAMADHRHLLVQAGTGTGKSYAYLVPALLHSSAAGERVLVSTATLALQRQLIGQDIPTALSALDGRLARPVSVAVVKGRGNYVCRLRLAESSGPEAGADALFATPGRLEGQADAVRRWADETGTGDRDDLDFPVDARVWRALSVSGRECVGRQRCPVGQDCFAEAARESAAAADVVVTNHTLLAIDLAGDLDVLPEYDVAIIDEAHDLAGRMTQAISQSLTIAGLAETGRIGAGLLGEGGLERFTDAATALADALPGAGAADSGDRRLVEAPTQLVRALALLRDAAHAALGELAAGTDASAMARRQAAVAAFTDVHDRAGLLMREEAGLVRWTTSDPVGLSCAPLSVADRLAGGLLRDATVVATSATLRLGGSFRAVAIDWGLPGQGMDLGAAAPSEDASAEGSWGYLDVGSPFDYRRQAILYLPRDLPAPGRDGLAAPALDRIEALVRAAGGRTLVLASSWRSVDTIADHLRSARFTGIEVLAQERGVPVGQLVREFIDHPGAVLVGTLSLWQGVDVPGADCTCVIIDKLPFPRPDDPVLAARSEAAAAGGGSGFAAISLPHAALLLAQGSGRLIRTDTDRGVVAILDPRLTQRQYGRYLLDSLPDMWRTSDTAVVVSALQRLRAASDAP